MSAVSIRDEFHLVARGLPGSFYATQLVQAMQEGHVVDFMYSNKYRVVEVHAVGWSTTGKLVMRGFQIDGQASRPLPQWTLFEINKIDMLEMKPMASAAPREGYTQGDKQMSPVLAELVI